MLNFKNIELNDVEIINSHLKYNNELSCENTFSNLLVWQSAYQNMYALHDNMLFLKSSNKSDDTFSLPFGDDLKKGIEIIYQYCKNKKPSFWVQEGSRLEKFLKLYGNDYKISEIRENFDYIYLQKDLAELKGKKFHSKRNHISAFSKKYHWRYESITQNNIADIKKCCKEWYAENLHRADSEMLYEKQGLKIILNNIERLKIVGGAIYVNDKVVAFSLGTPINDKIFDVQIEKALTEYSDAYPLINREFAKNELENYLLINREDDLGLEGLRKSKLSYKPHILLKKYILTAKD